MEENGENMGKKSEKRRKICLLEWDEEMKEGRKDRM